MRTLIFYLFLGSLFATVGSLLIGIVGFAKKGEFNKKYSAFLMQVRILFQSLTLILFALLLWIKA